MSDITYSRNKEDPTANRKCFLSEYISHMSNFVTHVDPSPQRHILKSRINEYKAFLIQREGLSEEEAEIIIKELNQQQ